MFFSAFPTAGQK